MKVSTLPKAQDLKWPLLALVLAFIAKVSFDFDRRLPPPIWEGRDLVAGLNPEKIQKIELVGVEKSVTLTRQPQGFVIENLDFAPVAAQKMNELILKLSGAQISKELGGKSEWSRYQLDRPELTIKLADLSGSTRVYHFGKSLPAQRGRPVRLEGNDTVFLTTEYLWSSLEKKDYLEREILKLNRDQISQITGLREGKEIKDIKRDKILDQLSLFKVREYYRSGTQSSELTQVNWGDEIRVEMKNGVHYLLSIGRRDSKIFARLQSFMTPKNESMSLGGLQVMNVQDMALKSQVDSFNQKHLPWVYELESGEGFI